MAKHSTWGENRRNRMFKMHSDQQDKAREFSGSLVLHIL